MRPSVLRVLGLFLILGLSACAGHGMGPAQAPSAGTAAAGGGLNDFLFGSTGPRGAQRDGLVQIAAKTVTRTVGSSIGRQIVRGLLGSLLGGKR